MDVLQRVRNALDVDRHICRRRTLADLPSGRRREPEGLHVDGADERAPVGHHDGEGLRPNILADQLSVSPGSHNASLMTDLLPVDVRSHRDRNVYARESADECPATLFRDRGIRDKDDHVLDEELQATVR